MKEKGGILMLLCFLLTTTLYAQSTVVSALDSIKITPSPYYAPEKANDPVYKGFIEISALPDPAAEITIYSISGEKIRTLIKKEGEHTQLWFLRNEKNELIESGIYIIHVQIKDLEEKILKFYYADGS